MWSLAVMLVCGLCLHSPPATAAANTDDLEAEIFRQRSILELLSRQVMLQQLFVEESIRSGGHSGVKQVRHNTEGSRPYYSQTHSSMETTADIHDHHNYINTAGMGEFVAVLNGVEFRTRHNDYKLVQPHSTSAAYHATEDIALPDVPPEVTSKGSVDLQIEEMRQWFKAFKDQDHSVRDYRQYFKPVLCYLEGAWTTGEELEESFESDRHFLDASSWQDLQEQVRFNSYTGRRSYSENVGYLPTTIMNIVNGVPELAQWNYRILCHPLKRDLPLNRLRLVDDLTARMRHKMTLDELAHIRAPRFQLNPKDEDHFVEGIKNSGLLDELMAEIPGKDNYQGHSEEVYLDQISVKYRSRDEKLNTAFYHRWYAINKEGTTSFSGRHRGFSDENLFMATTTHEDVASMERELCKGKTCSTIRQRWSYAIPLEIIYLTPLSSWNPYGLKYRGLSSTAEGRVVWADGRNGGHSKSEALDGTNSARYYLTPDEFYTDTPATMGPNKPKGVLDPSGEHVHLVRGAGVRAHFPDIPDVGFVRQRYPIMPVYGQGSSVWKELEAVKDILMEPIRHAHMFRENVAFGQPGGHAESSSEEYEYSGSGEDPMDPMDSMEVLLEMKYARAWDAYEHTHYVFLGRHEIEDLHKGWSLWVVTTEADYPYDDFHVHDLELIYDGYDYYYIRCDDRPLDKQCDGNHPKKLNLVYGPMDEGYMM